MCHTQRCICSYAKFILRLEFCRVVCPLSSGVGRTGAFCLLYAALQELEAGNGIPDLPLLVKRMRQQRKNMLQEKVRVVRVFQSCRRSARHALFKSPGLCLSPAPPEVLLRGRVEARRAGAAAARHHERHLQQEHQRSSRKGLMHTK